MGVGMRPEPPVPEPIPPPACVATAAPDDMSWLPTPGVLGSLEQPSAALAAMTTSTTLRGALKREDICAISIQLPRGRLGRPTLCATLLCLLRASQNLDHIFQLATNMDAMNAALLGGSRE